MIRACLLSLAFASPAFAQTNCGPRDAVAAALADKYGETVIARGLAETPQGLAMVEVWTNPDKRTFTVLITGPGGTSCLGASGGSFEMVDPVKPGDPA